MRPSENLKDSRTIHCAARNASHPARLSNSVSGQDKLSELMTSPLQGRRYHKCQAVRLLQVPRLRRFGDGADCCEIGRHACDSGCEPLFEALARSSDGAESASGRLRLRQFRCRRQGAMQGLAGFGALKMSIAFAAHVLADMVWTMEKSLEIEVPWSVATGS